MLRRVCGVGRVASGVLRWACCVGRVALGVWRRACCVGCVALGMLRGVGCGVGPGRLQWVIGQRDRAVGDRAACACGACPFVRLSCVRRFVFARPPPLLPPPNCPPLPICRILVFILANCVFLALDNPLDSPHSNIQRVLAITENVGWPTLCTCFSPFPVARCTCWRGLQPLRTLHTPPRPPLAPPPRPPTLPSHAYPTPFCKFIASRFRKAVHSTAP
jgi:hypothetical protein